MIILLMCNILIKLLCCSQELDHMLPLLNILTKFPCHLTLIGPCSTVIIYYCKQVLFLEATNVLKVTRGAVVSFWCVYQTGEFFCVTRKQDVFDPFLSIDAFWITLVCQSLLNPWLCFAVILWVSMYKEVGKLILFSCDDFGYP